MVITVMFLARFDCGADGPTTREPAHMNLNTALMSSISSFQSARSMMDGVTDRFSMSVP